MEEAINSSMQRGNNHDHAIKEATRQMRSGSNASITNHNYS
ncbi:hypothetical protein Gotur_003911 [Gossypium turneri]